MARWTSSRPIVALLLVALVVTACGGPNGSANPSTDPGVGEPPASARPDASAAAPQPSTGGIPIGALAALPADIVAAVDGVVEAGSEDERAAATEALLSSIGVEVSGDEGAVAESPAGIVLTPEELETMAAEAGHRDLYRATLADFATTFGGMALLPPNDTLAASVPEGWPESAGEDPGDQEVTLDLSSQPSHLAGVVNGWVTTAIESHASTDPDLVMLTNAPLLLAELARRRAQPLDLAQPFSADDLRLGWLEITILTAGMRAMLAGAEAAGIAASPAGDPESIVLATSHEGRADARSPLAADPPCDVLKQMIDSRVPLVSTHIGSYVGDAIKGFIQNFVNELFGAASSFARAVGHAFKVLGVVFKVQALVMLYSEATVSVEMDPTSYHKPDGANAPASAKVTAGIPDGPWEAAKQARQLSPFATALRTCARFLGLPVWQDFVDIGDAVDGWKVQWRTAQGQRHVQWAQGQFASGRLEHSLVSVNDHSGNDTVAYEVLPERREDHPGNEVSETVELCADVYPKEPPSGLGTILSAGTAGQSLAGGSVVGLAAVVARLLTSWVSTIAPISACAQSTVSFHVAVPGEWRGTITANTEVQESIESTVSTTDDYFGITTVTTRSTRTSIDVTDRFFVGGTEDPPGMGFVSLSGRQYTQGAGTKEEGSATVNAWNNTCGEYDSVVTVQAGGGWSFEEDTTASISLYPDGTYQINWSASGWDRDVVLPGESASQWTESRAECPAGSDTSNAPMYPYPLIGSGQTTMIEDQLDPENPGNVLRGQVTITNDDLSTTTISWNIVHEGPIPFPDF
ncbi:MAG TPA: hypothetical protein VI277_06735 [Candidatus Limnocylindria bacterium]